jgi:hypothetical protein
MNLTLSIDKNLLDNARKTAGAMGLSLNEMIRRYLEKVAGEGDRVGSFQELRELCTTRGGHSAGKTWNREELYRG